MSEREQLSLLAVGLPAMARLLPQLQIREVASAREMLAMMRVCSFDLLLAGERVEGMSVWSLMKRVKTAWPNQRWMFVSENFDEQDEIRARSLGALSVLDFRSSCEQLQDFAEALLQRLPAPSAPARQFAAASER